MSRWTERYRKQVANAMRDAVIVSRRSDSAVEGYAPKADASDPQYVNRVAIPTMAAVDQMPPEWRELVHEYGYVDVYRAWRRGIELSAVRSVAEQNNGFFRLQA